VQAHPEKAVHPENQVRQEVQEVLETNLEQVNQVMEPDTLKEAAVQMSLNQEQEPKELLEKAVFLINLTRENQHHQTDLAKIASQELVALLAERDLLISHTLENLLVQTDIKKKVRAELLISAAKAMRQEHPAKKWA
jgi:hypothetical protein